MMEKQKPFYYGGQAVIEGVMMRGRENLSVAVRKPAGDIDIMTKKLSPMYTGRLRRVPFIRGIIVLIETLALGIGALLHSANAALEDDEQEKMTAGMLWGSVVVGMVIAVAVFFILPLLITRYLIDPFIESALFSNVLEGTVRIAMFILYLWGINFMADIRRVFEYHGAEHKVVNAYEAGAPLEVESIQQYSTAHARCGTNFLLVVLILSIFVFAIFGRPDIWMSILSRIVLIPVIASIGYEFIRFGGAHMHNPVVHVLLLPGLLLQAMTTRQPDNGQIEVAVAALKRVIEDDNPDYLISEQS